MKNLKNIITKTILVAFTIYSISLTTSCSGDDGKDGINGTNGANGETGTANVMYSNWINQNFNVEYTATYGGMMDISEPRITTSIINNGYVLGFWKFSSQSYVYTLPYSNGGYLNIKREMNYFPEKIRFFVWRFDNSFAISDLWFLGDATSGVPQYRYIIVPGGVNIAGRGIAKPDYTKMSYHEICSIFNIPE